MPVAAIPGLEHLPFAEVWLNAADEHAWQAASEAARALGKAGLEVWTTDRTPEVAPFLEQRGYAVVRRYEISELEVAAASVEPPALEVTTLAEHPVPAEALHAIAAESYLDQPGRAGTRIGGLEDWRVWGLEPHPPEAFFLVLDGDAPLGYGYLELDGERATHGFTAVARAARGRGVAGAIKRAQIRWAAAHGIRVLRTANETRLVGLIALNRRLGYRLLYTELVLRGPAWEGH